MSVDSSIMEQCKLEGTSGISHGPGEKRPGDISQNTQTDREKWAEWEEEYKGDLARVTELVESGHNRHCSFGIVWGSGECTCKKGMK